jgi:hypothetical protein
MLQYAAPFRFKEGAVGELQVDSVEFTDDAYLRGENERRSVALRPAGTELRVALSIRPQLDKNLQQFFVQEDTPYDITAKIGTNSRFVKISVGGSADPDLFTDSNPAGLWFVFRGMEPLGMESGVVDLPRFPGLEPVESLNQAFTRLSEVFEPWRKAHTGNIYEKIFYEESANRWAPLDELRNLAIKEWWGHAENEKE